MKRLRDYCRTTLNLSYSHYWSKMNQNLLSHGDASVSFSRPDDSAYASICVGVHQEKCECVRSAAGYTCYDGPDRSVGPSRKPFSSFSASMPSIRYTEIKFYIFNPSAQIYEHSLVKGVVVEPMTSWKPFL